jgi:2-polyprenyl-3-methyl-5-hydroxy-6-metoxy-1,4-benzoquinol methylase
MPEHTRIKDRPAPIPPDPRLSAERFDPAQGTGRLEASEHYLRYLWAAAIASTKMVLDAGCGTGYGSELLAKAGAARVVGVDIEPEALPSSSDYEAVEFVVADLRSLPFADAEFQMVTCFEVIEHLDDRSAALRELRRVLSDDGFLLLSSPNRDAYPSGNPHHVFEYVPAELTEEVAIHFDHVALYRQDAWLASSLTEEDLDVPEPGREVDLRMHVVGSPGSRGAPFSIVAASNAELPTIPDRGVLGDPFEVRWWHERLQADAAAARARLRKLQAVKERDRQRMRAEIRELGEALVKLESRHANEVEELRNEVQETLEELGSAREDLADARSDYAEAQRTIQAMHRTRIWRLGSAYWRFRDRLLRRRSA